MLAVVKPVQAAKSDLNAGIYRHDNNTTATTLTKNNNAYSIHKVEKEQTTKQFTKNLELYKILNFLFIEKKKNKEGIEQKN